MEISTVFKEKGLRVTPQRRVVYQVLGELCHSSVDEVVAAVGCKNPNITVATVYNVLDTFAQKEIISRLNTTKGKLYYDINPQQHHHIVTADDKIIDYLDGNLEKLIYDYLAKNPVEGCDVERVSLQLYVKQ